MVIWGIFWGAVLGAFWPGYGNGQMFMGGVLGLLVGLSLRWVVRKELAKKPVEAVPRITQVVVRSDEPMPVPALATSPLQPDVARTSYLQGDPSPEELEAALAANQAEANPRTNMPDGQTVAAAIAQETAQNTSKSPAQSVKAPTPVTPAQPNAMERGLLEIKNWFLGGNTIVRVGLVILFIGLSFLARYAAAAGLLPVEFRLAAIGAAGIALLAVGFRKRSAKPGFSLALQGAGVAVLYLTVFAAFRLYGLIPALPAFALMVVVCGLSCALAMLQDSRSLAVVAFAGGFAVPVLLSSGQGGHVALFSYYTVLNLAILFIAYRRSWRVLNLLGFVATFVVAGAWGVLKYVPDHYATTQPFLVGFILIYISMAVLYARNTPTRLGNAVDSTLVFGIPLVGFGIQVGLVDHLYLGTAFSALGFAVAYLLLAMVLVRRSLDNYRLLIECFIALGVGFATLAVPLALDAQWTSAVWALEGAGAFWVGMRQARWMPRAFGLLLQAVAALAFLSGTYTVSALPLLNPGFIGALLIALPAFMLAWWLRKPLAHSGSTWAKGYARVEDRLGSPVYLYGFGFWCLAFVLEIHRAKPDLINLMPQGISAAGFVDVFSAHAQHLLALLAVVGSAALSLWLGTRWVWPVATWPSRFTLLVMAGSLLAQLADGHRILVWPAWLVWPVVLLLHYALLRHNDRHSPSNWLQKFNHWVHAGTVWLIALLLADALWFVIGKGDLLRTSWASVVLLFSAIAVLMGLVLWAGRANRQPPAGQPHLFGWPLQTHASAYYWSAAAPLVVLVFVGALALALLSRGSTQPLPYIPLLNPTELAIALGMGAMVLWRRRVLAAQPLPPGAQRLQGPSFLTALAALAFVVLNTVWLRIAHHFFGVDWYAHALFNSFVVQTGYAILWSLLALTLMVTAHRRAARALWVVGAGLLGAVVIKLVLIDLANAGGVERIVAFIAVGLLMLVVGYFAPMPPKAALVDSSIRTQTMNPTDEKENS